MKKSKSPIWTVIYNTPGSCYHIELGHKDGAPISYRTVKRMSLKFLKTHKDKHGLEDLRVIFPASYDRSWDVRDHWRRFNGQGVGG